MKDRLLLISLSSEPIQDFNIKGTWTDKTTPYGYDFWYQPRHDVVVSSEFGSPNVFKQGFDPLLVVRPWLPWRHLQCLQM